jgi:CubicO group peptidase (beta-lactamase class C family)
VYLRNWKWLVGVCATVAAGIAAGAPGEAGKSRAPASPLSQRVDALFAPWAHVDTPGCALAVGRDGKMLYEHGYGMADIEHGVPNSPATVFNIASVSKQFTAFAIYLLAQEGRLSLDDDVRKYLPELNDFGTTITLQHLLHHTSGLRDHDSLQGLAGWRLYEDVSTEDDILNLTWRQKALNFLPGNEFLYSNTGYVLLGLIVERLSGQSIASFEKERIFEPLGMQNAQVHENYGDLVPGRAYSYVKGADDRYRYIASSDSNVGSGGVFTTVGDLTRWGWNLDDGRVGGRELVEQMQVPARLKGDKPGPYGAGFFVWTYRGLKVVEHGGANAGYRAALVRFPEQRFSVALLCNTDEVVSPEEQAIKVADVFLGKVLGPAQPQAKKPAEIKIDPRTLDALTGEYLHHPGVTITYTKENDHLVAQATGQSKFVLYPSGIRTFTYKTVNATVTFGEPGADGMASTAVHHQGGDDFTMPRVHRTPLTATELQDREGEFYSDELHVLYTVFDRDGGLVLRYPRGEIQLRRGADVDSYWAEFPIGTVHYSCRSGKGCDGFTVSDGRVRNLWFMRAEREFNPVKIDPGALDSFVGDYRLAPDVVVSVTRNGGRLFSQATGGLRYELFPSGNREFFSKASDFQGAFTVDSQGSVVEMVVRHDGLEQVGQRVRK